jgi:hypothetical protein
MPSLLDHKPSYEQEHLRKKGHYCVAQIQLVFVSTEHGRDPNFEIFDHPSDDWLNQKLFKLRRHTPSAITVN